MLSNFPVIEYDLNKYVRDYYFRIAFIDNYVKNNSSFFYKYILQHGDTPESVSNKFYGTDKYWYLILLINNIEDPFYDWKLSDYDCMDYAKKFVSETYPTLTGTAKQSKIDEIYTLVAENNANKAILLPKDNIVGVLYNELLSLIKTFKSQ